MKTCPSCKKSVKPNEEDKCPDCGADLSKVKMQEGDPLDALAEGTIIGGDDLPQLVESAQIIKPKKGNLFEDRVIEGGHTVKVAKFAIIRPCQSRGRSIRGLQPIYEPRMLAENAAVFAGWPMFLDHMSEELVEALSELLQEKGRSMKDLGGRVLKSYYDPEVSLEEDDSRGYRKGAVVGEVIPYKLVREMLEEDPLALNVSINAWPTKVRVGSPSWNPGGKGAVIEGIRSKPMGSVDFVVRGGAGGRPLTEDEIASAVSLLESCFTSPRDGDPDRGKERTAMKKLSQMSESEIAKLTPEQLAEALKEENPQLAESLNAKPEPSNTGGGDSAITEEQLNKALREQREAITEEFKGAQLSEEQVEERANEIVREREELRSLSELANSKLAEAQANGLPKEYVEEIRKNYLLLPSGARAGLLVEERDDDEGNKLTREALIEEQIKADIATAVKLIEAAGGKPRIKGLGPSKPDEGGEDGKKKDPMGLKEGNAFLEFMAESGTFVGDAEKDSTTLTEMVEEGV